MVGRALTCAQEPINEIEVHAFGDASKKGVCATVHAVVRQPSCVNQGLVTAKAPLAKEGITIPRLERGLRAWQRTLSLMWETRLWVFP